VQGYKRMAVILKAQKQKSDMLQALYTGFSLCSLSEADELTLLTDLIVTAANIIAEGNFTPGLSILFSILLLCKYDYCRIVAVHVVVKTFFQNPGTLIARKFSCQSFVLYVFMFCISYVDWGSALLDV
jgi:hypothetical protein